MRSTSLLSPVLVVDDNPDDIFFLRRLLSRAQVANPVITFTDSVDALAFLRALDEGPDAAVLRPGVLFLDLKMPRIHGFVLLKWLRRQVGFDRMKIAVLSGSDEPKDRLRAEKLGADEYLVKFPEAPVLAELVASARALPV
jgi:CheY-like chemotaxis protein